MTRASPSQEQSDFAFVIPVLHPNGPKVSDYGVVEKSLRLTVESLTSQTQPGVPIIIVCHKRPDWHDTVPQTVKFLLIENHPGVSADVIEVKLDKGVKFLAGIWYAIKAHNPKLLMPMDADDFVRKDLARVFLDIVQKDRETDCFIITRGYHAALGRTVEGFNLHAAFEIKKFDRTCGTSRVFNGQNFQQKLLEAAPDIAKFDLSDIADDTGVLDATFLDFLVNLSKQDIEDEDSYVRVMGRHTGQDKRYKIREIDQVMSAKACGHGNHVGKNAGDIHWRKILRIANSRTFMSQFGLSNAENLSPSLSLGVKASGLTSIIDNIIKRRI